MIHSAVPNRNLSSPTPHHHHPTTAPTPTPTPTTTTILTTSFIDESAVFLVDQGISEVEVMMQVLAVPREEAEAKTIALVSLRSQLYDRNLQVGGGGGGGEGGLVGL